MKITAEYKGKQVTFDVPDETLDKLIEEPKKTGWEKPECSESYWFVNPSKNTDGCRWDNHPVDQVRYDKGNCFTSKELAENIARYQSLDLRIRRRIAEICEPNKLNRASYIIRYNNDKIEVVCMCCTYATWRFDTKEHAEQIINEFREELMWYFTEFKDRMDG